ncbi:MAG: mannitol dehydrogenase family protein [Gammaproteobacteria bacterium]|nr:mannitol dehydrogenase family protein [Gammaproteobacteria bacterium]
MKRLDGSQLQRLPAHIGIPTYDRQRCAVGIVHLGIGAFHRAHQAFYTDAVMNRSGGDWRIVGASLRSRAVQNQLMPQQGLYTVTQISGEERDCRVIGAVSEVIFVPQARERLLQLMADPATRIVSLTVTEKGYYRDPTRGTLLTGEPTINADLQQPHQPASAIGLLVQALDMRRLAGLPPFTVLSCDNLPDNGRSLRAVVLEYAALALPQAADWIATHVAFPSSMVDRIVPAMTADGLAMVADDLGLRDEGAIITEPFTQWVIEDRFTMGRPAWESAGAMLVKDVAPYELIKLRLLNGTHSALAYLGYLGGMEHIADCMQNHALRSFAERLMREEILATVIAPQGFDIHAYIEALLARFSNPALRHRCWQIAMDGSQKLPQRLLGTIIDRLRHGASIDRLALAIAAWIQYVSGRDLRGQPIDVRDPLAESLRERVAPHSGDAAAMTAAALQTGAVFDAALGANSAFRSAVTQRLALLQREGALAAAVDRNTNP